MHIKNALFHKKTRVISIAVAVVLIVALAAVLIPNALSKETSDPSLTYTNTVIGGTISFPESWKGKYITTPVNKLDTETFIQVFDKANNEKHKGQNPTFGWLFSIKKLDSARFDELWPSYKEIGGAKPIARDGKYVYLMRFPTDVQCDASDESLKNGYNQLESGIDEVVAGFISENKLTTYDFTAYMQKYILPFVNSGTAFKNWSNAEENEPEAFLEIYKYAAAQDPQIDPLQFARDNGIDYAVPRDIVEGSVTKYFDVSKEYLRTMRSYNSELQCYVDQYNSSGPDPVPDILSYTENGNNIVIKFENRWSDDSFEGGIYEVGINKMSDGSFKYAYSKILSGADSTDIDTDASLQKYYDYFDQNNWQITSLLAYDNANGFDDASLMTFAIMGLPNYSYENGHTKAEIDAVLKKYFVRTVKNYVTSASEYVPGTDRIRATGWSYDSSTKMVLYKLVQNSDGTKTGYFDAYTISDTFLIDHPDLDLKNDLLSGKTSAYGPPQKVAIVFVEGQNRDGLILQYKSITKGNAADTAVQPAVGNEPVSWSADKYLTDEEMTVAGVKTGMSYEEALAILGGYDEAYDNTQTVKSIIKDGLHFGFYQIDETFTNQSDLKKDGVFRLLDLSTVAASQYEFPRGIKIGDSIEAVLSKFPGKDKELRKWAYQNIYGKDEIGKPRAFLEFVLSGWRYRFVATTTKQTLEVDFNRENRVSSVTITKEDS